LQWSVKYSQYYDFYKKLQDDGVESPLDKLPHLSQSEVIYYDDFNILGTERVGGTGINYIPVTKILDYARMSGVINRSLFKRIIHKIDVGYVKLVNKQQEAESRRNAKKRKSH